MLDDVSITDATRRPGLAPRTDADVTVFPVGVDEGRGVYPQSSVGIVEELSAAGVRGVFWDEPDQRELVEDRGVFVDIAVQLMVGIASAAGWDAVRALLRRRSGRIRLTLAYRSGPEHRWLAVEGDAPGVAAALERIDPFKPPRPTPTPAEIQNGA